MDIVTHELRILISAIKVSDEILFEDNDFTSIQKDRLLTMVYLSPLGKNRLINKGLDLEKFEMSKQKIYATENGLNQTIQKVIKPLEQLLKNKNRFVFFRKKYNKCLL